MPSEIDFPFATDDNYAAGSFSGAGQPNKVAPSAALQTQGFRPDSKAWAPQFNYFLNRIASMGMILQRARVYAADQFVQANVFQDWPDTPDAMAYYADLRHLNEETVDSLDPQILLQAGTDVYRGSSLANLWPGSDIATGQTGASGGRQIVPLYNGILLAAGEVSRLGANIRDVAPTFTIQVGRSPGWTDFRDACPHVPTIFHPSSVTRFQGRALALACGVDGQWGWLQEGGSPVWQGATSNVAGSPDFLRVVSRNGAAIWTSNTGGPGHQIWRSEDTANISGGHTTPATVTGTIFQASTPATSRGYQPEWCEKPVPPNSSKITGFTKENGLWLAVAIDGVMASTDNGVTWQNISDHVRLHLRNGETLSLGTTAGTFFFSSNDRALATDGAHFFAVVGRGSTSQIAWSPDGVNWFLSELIVDLSNGRIWSMVAQNGKGGGFVLIDDGNDRTFRTTPVRTNVSPMTVDL